MVLIIRLYNIDMMYGGCNDCMVQCWVQCGWVDGVWYGHGYYVVCMCVVCNIYVQSIWVVYGVVWGCVWYGDTNATFALNSVRLQPPIA